MNINKRNINNVIKEVMELRMQFLREYYKKFIGDYSKEFKDEYFDDNINYTNNKQLIRLQERYALSKSKFKDVKTHFTKILAEDLSVDEDWLEFLVNRYNNGNITEDQFLLSSFVLFPDYGVLQESDMITVIEKLTMSEEMQNNRIDMIAEQLNISAGLLKKHMLSVLKEHMEDYKQVKEIGMKQLQEQNRTVDKPYGEDDWKNVKGMLKG